MENHFGISEEEYWWKTFTSEAMDSTVKANYGPLDELCNSIIPTTR
jgi:hypothetical protein